MRRSSPVVDNRMSLSQTGNNVTHLLIRWGDGDREALDALTPMVYDEMRKLASRYLRRERPDHTLSSTALVHEAYMRLVDQRNVQWQNRNQFFGLASELIRRDPGGSCARTAHGEAWWSGL